MLERFSISLEQDLLKKFDRRLRSRKYASRSESIRDLIRKSLVEEEWDADEEVVGVVTLVYDHHQRRLQDRITEVQHDFHQFVVSTTHIHLDHDNCLEVIIARGNAGRIKTLADSLIALRGVKNGELSTASTGKHIH
jgi:CopG family transcriptional regulator, nickel-responsive regulator